MAERVSRSTPRTERLSDQPPARPPTPDFDRMVEGLSVDQYALDEELIKNGKNFHAIADAVALATSRRDAASDEIKQVEAEVDRLIRQSMADGSTPKMPEDGIKRSITLHADVIAARARLRIREEEMNRLIALKESYNQRSYAIKDLVSLQLAAYFGTTGITIRNDVNREGREARHMSIRKDQNEHRLRNRDKR